MTNQRHLTVTFLAIAAVFAAAVFAAYGLGQQNAPWPNDTVEWRTVAPDEPPNVGAEIDRHLCAGNCVSIETQVSEVDCSVRYIVTLLEGSPEGIEIKVPIEEPPPFAIDPDLL